MRANEILAGGARLIREHKGAVAVWGGLQLLAGLAMLALFVPMFADMATFQQSALIAQATGAPPPEPPLGFFGWIVLLDVGLLVMLAVIFAAAVRATASGGRDRFAFLRFGMDEVRLIGLGLLLIVAGAVVFAIVAVVLILVVAFVATALGGGAQTAGAGLVIVLFIALALASLWVQVRLSLAGAFTVLRGRIVIAEAWRATRGRFWTLFGVYLLIGIVYWVLMIAVLLIVSPAALAGFGATDPAAIEAQLAAQQAMLADPFTARTLIGWAIGLVGGTLLIAFAFGAIATAALIADREGVAG